MAGPSIVNLTAYRGDSFAQMFRFLDSAHEPIDLTDASVAAWAAHNGDAPVHLEVTVGPDPGFVTLELPSGMLAGVYQYDLEITTPSAVKTWVAGRLIVEQDVTHRV